MQKALVIDLEPYYRTGSIEKRPDWGNWSDMRHRRVNSSATALQLLTDEVFPLIVIHVRDAEAEGIELCAKIRRISGAPIVLTGGSTEFRWTRKALQLQVSDYLPVPFTHTDVEACLQKAMQTNGERSYPSAEDTKLINNKPVNSDHVIQQVKKLAKDAMYQDITLKEIAQSMHFNYSYLVQKFKTHENMTFNEYLLKKRMERAKSLLIHTDMKVYEIAGQVGYNDMDWFYKKFKAYFGVSANNYRKEHKLQSTSLVSSLP